MLQGDRSGRPFACLITNPVSYLTTSVTTPAPTVRPPSRIAKRNPSSMAIGALIGALFAMSAAASGWTLFGLAAQFGVVEADDGHLAHGEKGVGQDQHQQQQDTG